MPFDSRYEGSYFVPMTWRAMHLAEYTHIMLINSIMEGSRCVSMLWQATSLADIARHVTGRPCKSRKEGSRCEWMTWRAVSGRPDAMANPGSVEYRLGMMVKFFKQEVEAGAYTRPLFSST
jgi:hypothetical protein